MKKLIPLFALALMMTVPSAAALSAQQAKECNALAQSFGPAKASLEKKMAERDRLASETEALGEAWENAENVRTLGADAAAEADALKVSFDAKKADFDAVQADLFEKSNKLNADFARFNTLCVADE